MELPDLAIKNMIYTFIYGLNPCLKGFPKVQVKAIIGASLNKVMIVAIKLEKVV